MRKQIFVLVPDLCKKYFDRDKDICYHINHASIPIRGMHVIVYSNESTSLLRRRRIEMKKYGVNELRKMFLDFMESKGHLVLKSFPLKAHHPHLRLPAFSVLCGSSLPECSW